MNIYKVSLKFQYPAYDERGGVADYEIEATSKREAATKARKFAERDGHLPNRGCGRSYFTATLVCQGEVKADDMIFFKSGDVWHWRTKEGSTLGLRQGFRSQIAAKRHCESVLVEPVIYGRDCGNKATKKTYTRSYCLALRSDFVRDASGRVRRFFTVEGARRAAFDLFMK